MFQLTSLQWKSFFRSASFAGNIFSKIIMFIGVLYVTLISLSLGVIHGSGGSIIQPDAEDIANPFSWINKSIIYGFGYWIVVRYIFQKVPILNLRALLLTPLRKSRIIRYALNQTIFSIFNLVSFFYLIPFSILVVADSEPLSFDLLGIVTWNIAIACIVYITNFINIILNKQDRLVVGFAIILLIIKSLEYYDFVDLTFYSEKFFYSFYETPILVLGPIALLIYTYYYVYRYFRFNLSIDEGLNIQTKEAIRNDFNWLDRFGSISIFLKNDLRLILRTKRAKSTVIMGFSFVFYGFLIMFSNDLFGDWWLFVGLFFSTGGFMLTFCGLVPSWDSKHYSLMMCQNITYLDYLKSKWYLGIIGTTVMTIMASFIYSYFGIFYIVTIICAGLYNLGINSYVTLWAGAFNKSAIDLESNKNAFGDKKSFNTKTMLMTIPQLIGPVLIFSYVSSNFDSFIAAYVIGAIGIIGMFFRNLAFKIIVKTYKSEKYSTLSAYKQTN